MVAEEERRMISRRTKDALAAAKKRGVKFGGYRNNAKFTTAVRKAAVAAKADKVAKRAADLAPVIAELQAAGAASLRSIADGLNQRGIPTARGNAVWSATQVMRVMARHSRTT